MIRYIASLSLLALCTCAKTDATFVDAGVDMAVAPDIPHTDSYQNPCAPGAPPALAGTVYAPNGIDPVAGAAVGILTRVEALPQAVRCGSCAVADGFRTLTFADSAGRFRLERIPSDGSSFKLSLQRGYFRRVIDVAVDGCKTLELTKDQTTLPGRNQHYGSDDTVPRIAVVTGAWDRLEKVLDKLGVQDKKVFNGQDVGSGPQSAQTLLQNGALLAQFHMVFINCGTRYEGLVTEPGAVRANLKEYVEKGGRLFVTDYSYDFVEHTFPEFIDFEGDENTPPDKPERANAAELGAEGMIIEATVLDPDLRAWLALTEIAALLPNDKLQVLGFQTAWAVQREVKGKVWVEGGVRGIGVDPKLPRPLTSSFDIQSNGEQCGRVFFSSYHTHGEGKVLLPQERVLEYLMLEIAGCPRVR